MKLVDVVAWILNGFIFFLLIKSILLRRKTKKIVKEIEESREERYKKYDEFVERIEKQYNEFIEEHNARLDLLSRENNKLRSQNEELKERLRDLGIRDFDVL